MKKRLSQTFLANIYEKLDNIKLSKRPKVSSEEFQIPSVFNYSHIIYFNYNVSQLRSISRFYKQKISFRELRRGWYQPTPDKSRGVGKR